MLNFLCTLCYFETYWNEKLWLVYKVTWQSKIDLDCCVRATLPTRYWDSYNVDILPEIFLFSWLSVMWVLPQSPVANNDIVSWAEDLSELLNLWTAWNELDEIVNTLSMKTTSFPLLTWQSYNLFSKWFTELYEFPISWRFNKLYKLLIH